MIISGPVQRRMGKRAVLRRQVAAWRALGKHVHVMHPDWTECTTDECPPCPAEGCNKLAGHGGGRVTAHE